MAGQVNVGGEGMELSPQTSTYKGITFFQNPASTSPIKWATAAYVLEGNGQTQLIE